MPTLQRPGRMETIAAHREAGGGIAAVLPIHYPRALLRAFDLLPVEVWGPPGADQAAGEGRLQAYTCSIVHRALAFVRSGGLDLAQVIVAPHACDSLQGLASLLLDFCPPRPPVLPLYLPRGNRRADHLFLADELRSLGQQLRRLLNRCPDDETLHRCIDREAEADELLGELLRRRPALGASNRRFYELLRLREYLPAERFAAQARALIERPEGELSNGPRLLLAGIVPEPMALLDLLDELGVVVVADDMASIGRRLYPPGSDGDPYLRMAERLLGGPPDPTRGCAVGQRVDHLVTLARASGDRAVLFFEVKFCEPEQVYLPLTRRALEEAGLPSLVVEVDIGEDLPGQLVTRIEALVEMI